MWIEVDYAFCRLTSATEEERNWLSDYLSFTDSAARFKKGAADGKLRMFNTFNLQFPIGYLRLVKKAAQMNGFAIEVADRRTAPCVRDASADLEWLRWYQKEAVDQAISKTSGILWLSTGAGKTEIAVGLAKALPCQWLFLVHRSSLMDQTAERYERRTGLIAGRIGDGKWDVPADSKFIVATFQSIAARMKHKGASKVEALRLLSRSEGLIVDECHVLPAWSFWNTSMACPAYYRFGLSGTPLARGDQRSVFAIASLGPIIYRVKPETLIDEGVLAKPHIRMIDVQHPKPKNVTWPGVYGEAVVRSAARNANVVEAVRRAEKPTFLFVKEISHGRTLEKLLWKAGIKPGFVFGTHSTENRARHVRDLLAGRIDVLICSVIFQEGIDVPELRSVVVASGGRSVIGTLQKLGRGMRPDKRTGKTEFDCWEFFDRGCGCTKVKDELGEIHAHTGCKWLERHSHDRQKAYAQEGYEVVIEQMIV